MTGCSQNTAQIFDSEHLLVLMRKIMEPCSIQIRHPKVDNKGGNRLSSYSLPFVFVYYGHIHRSLGSYYGNKFKKFNPATNVNLNAPEGILP